MPRKPLWVEGLFLTEHHFQALDRWHENLLDARLRAVLPYGFGISTLKLDDRALAIGQVRVSRIEAVLPDGTLLIAGDGADVAIPARAFDRDFEPQMRELDVWVAVPRERLGHANLDEARAGVGRFVRGQEKLRDANTGGGEQSLDFADLQPRMIFGHENREGLEAIRVAQLVRSPSGAVVFSPSFVPAALALRGVPSLQRDIRGLLAAMVAKQRQLSSARRQRATGRVEVDGEDVPRLIFLQALNANIPRLAHIVEDGGASLEQVYLALGDLFGALCTLSADEDPTSLPRFDYLDLGPVFEQTIAKLNVLLEATIRERFLEIPLQLREGGIHAARAADPSLLRGELYLAVSGALPEAQIRDRFAKLLKIASWSQIGAIVHSAMSGARAELEYRPPSALPLRPGVFFFKIDKSPDFWTDIQASGTLAIYHPFDVSAVQLALYVVREGA
jgi:type VI secretion system protein ImpJ